jgi:hypothetical protein
LKSYFFAWAIHPGFVESQEKGMSFCVFPSTDGSFKSMCDEVIVRETIDELWDSILFLTD